MYQAKELPQPTFEQTLSAMFVRVGIEIAELKCNLQMFSLENEPHLRNELEKMERSLVDEVIDMYLDCRHAQNDDFLSLFQNDLDFLYQKRYIQLIFRHVDLLRYVLTSFGNK